MPPIYELAVPFLTREMLNFGREATLELLVRSVATVVRTFNISGATREGLIRATHTSFGNKQAQISIHRIPDIPIFFSVIPSATVTIQGRLHVTVSLRINGDIVFPLVSGYVYDHKPLSWPETNLRDNVPNHGNIEEIYTDDPAAGQEIEYFLEPNELWHITHCAITLVTSATVADRRVHLVFQGGRAGQIHCFAAINQTASQTRKYSFAPYGTILSEQDNGVILVNLPKDLWIDGEGTISTITTNLQAGDNFSRLKIFRELFFQGA